MPSSPRFVTLHGQGSTVILECPAGEAPLWRYWGPRLATGASPGIALRDTRPEPSFSLGFDQPLTLAPTFGLGWFGGSALSAHRGGHDFAQAFDGCEVEQIRDGEAVRFVLTDSVAAIRLAIDLALDPHSDVLVIRSELVNLGNASLDVQWLAAATLPLPGRCAQVRSYAGQHMHEFLLQRDDLGRSTWRRESRRGRTSHDCFPGAVVTT